MMRSAMERSTMGPLVREQELDVRKQEIEVREVL